MTCFDPRPCARGDRVISWSRRTLDGFRSTPLREGRRGRPAMRRRAQRCFDPRPCARGDRVDGAAECGRRVSIHAPARGATARRCDAATADAVFRSTPLREGRPPLRNLFRQLRTVRLWREPWRRRGASRTIDWGHAHISSLVQHPAPSAEGPRFQGALGVRAQTAPRFTQ